MAEYITKESAIEVFEWGDADVIEEYGDGSYNFGFSRETIKNSINTIPAADVVEVVRCQNCKHSAEWERGLWCTWHDDMYAWENYFCADGKGKDEE